MKQENIALVIFLVFIVGAGVYYSYSKTENFGDTPSITQNSCPLYTSSVAQKLGISIAEIHSCTTKSFVVDGEAYVVITVEYGAPQDCIAGCFYAGAEFAIRTKDNKITALPNIIEGHSFQNFPMPETKMTSLSWAQMTCDPTWTYENSTTWNLARKNGELGYEVRFTRPLVCNWEEVKSQVFPVDYTTSTITSDFVETEWNGTVFLTLETRSLDIHLRERSRVERTYVKRT